MKNTKKLLALLIASVLTLTAMVSCGGNEKKDTATTDGTTTAATTAADGTDSAEPDEEYTPVDMKVFAMNGPTGMGMSKLIKDNEDGATANNYDFTLVSSADEIKAEILKGAYDIAAVPTNLAAVLFAKTEGALRVAAVNTLGVLYILENGNTVNSVADLDGKTIAATGQGSVPEYVLSYILEANNVNATVLYYTDGAEVAQKMLSGDIDLAMLPVPYATNVLTKNEDIRIAANITEEWEKTGNDAGALCQGCVIVRSDFAEENPQAVDKFLEEYAASVLYVNENVEAAAALLETYKIVASAQVGAAAIPAANIVCITGDEMATALTGFYSILHASNPASVGGAVPSTEIYYISEK